MELAIHLRENVNGIHECNFHSSLLSHFHHIKNNTLATLDQKISFLERIYIGDEFCFNRLPNFYFIDHIVDFIYKKNIGLTLLTPILSQINFFSFSEILEYLHQKNPNTEIVVNDWGMIFFLKEKFPSFNLSIGRLLNKGFKDPRLRAYDYELTDEALNLLNSSTFDDPIFQDFVSNLGINRLESDIFPYKDQLIPSYKNLNTSIYFPFTYITSGRNCLPSINDTSPRYFFVPLHKCSQPCSQFMIRLLHSSFIFPVFQFGNTIFFKLTHKTLSKLFASAEQNNVRLVYQGLAYEDNSTC